MAYPYKKQLIINGKNIEITLRSDADASVFFEVFEDKEYSLLESIIKTAKNPIIDIGAHTGMFSIYASVLNENIPILAYEPAPENFEFLKQNFRANHLTNVFPKNLAVSAEVGQRVLFLSQDSHNHSMYKNMEEEKEQKIFSTSLSQIITKMQNMFSTKKSALLKIDAEGIEFEIFEKIDKKILENIENIYMEYHELLPEMRGVNLKKILEKSGYKVKIFPSKYDSRYGFILATK